MGTRPDRVRSLDERRRRREFAELLASGLNMADMGQQRGGNRAAIHYVRKDLIAAWEKFHQGEGAFEPGSVYPLLRIG